MPLTSTLHKLIKNNGIALMFVLPNLGINAAVQVLLDVGFHWSGWWAILAWLIGGAISFEFGILLSMLTKSNFKIGRWRYSYAREEKI